MKLIVQALSPSFAGKAISNSISLTAQSIIQFFLFSVLILNQSEDA